MTRPKPAAEVAIDAALVRGLLADQHPDLADRTLAHVSGGWDNEIYRLGDDRLVRLPRRQVAAALTRNEQRFLAEIAPRLPLAVPVPLRVGAPGRDYPHPWSVCAWFEGETALGMDRREFIPVNFEFILPSEEEVFEEIVSLLHCYSMKLCSIYRIKNRSSKVMNMD